MVELCAWWRKEGVCMCWTESKTSEQEGYHNESLAEVVNLISINCLVCQAIMMMKLFFLRIHIWPMTVCILFSNYRSWSRVQSSNKDHPILWDNILDDVKDRPSTVHSCNWVHGRFYGPVHSDLVLLCVPDRVRSLIIGVEIIRT